MRLDYSKTNAAIPFVFPYEVLLAAIHSYFRNPLLFKCKTLVLNSVVRLEKNWKNFEYQQQCEENALTLGEIKGKILTAEQNSDLRRNYFIGLLKAYPQIKCRN